VVDSSPSYPVIIVPAVPSMTIGIWGRRMSSGSSGLMP
jgi:hypothetical protein